MGLNVSADKEPLEHHHPQPSPYLKSPPPTTASDTNSIKLESPSPIPARNRYKRMSASSDQHLGAYPTPAASQASSQVQSPIVAQGIQYSLGEGLATAVYKHFIDNHPFSGAVRAQARVLSAGHGEQYVVFSPVSEEQLTKIDKLRDTHYKRLRFTYLQHQQILIVKVGMPGQVNERATRGLGYILRKKTSPMELDRDLQDFGSTRYQGSGSSKEADVAFQPMSSRPGTADWPTVVIECGVSEGLTQLKGDASWWLDNSAGDVKIVLLLAIKQSNKTIHIEKWEKVPVPNPLATRASPGTSTPVAEQTASVDILWPVSANGSLTLEFNKVFLRPAVQDYLEGDVILSVADLEDWATDIWRGVP